MAEGARLIPIMAVMWLCWTPYKLAYIDHRVPKPLSLCLMDLYTIPPPYTPLTQLNKCGALLNGPHFSPAASDPDTKAPQKLFQITYKSLQKLQEADDEKSGND